MIEREFLSTHPIHTPAEQQRTDEVDAAELEEFYRPPRTGIAAFASLTRAGAVTALSMPMFVGMALVVASGWNGGRLVYVWGVNVGM